MDKYNLVDQVGNKDKFKMALTGAKPILKRWLPYTVTITSGLYVTYEQQYSFSIIQSIYAISYCHTYTPLNPGE